MAKKEKTLTKSTLIGMQVIDAEGNLVGKVKDVAFAIGKAGVSLSVESVEGEERTIDWEAIQAAGDFIILKPVQQSATPIQTAPVQTQQAPTVQPEQTAPAAAQPGKTSYPCPTCGKPLTYIQQYQRWYCYNEKKYV